MVVSGKTEAELAWPAFLVCACVRACVRACLLACQARCKPLESSSPLCPRPLSRVRARPRPRRRRV